MRVVLFAVLLAMLLPGQVLAHHGKDYVELEGYASPEKGEYLLFSLFEYHVPERSVSDLDYWKIQPGILYGITNHLSLEAHAHLTKVGSESFAYESTALEARFRFLEEGDWFVNPAASVEYERSASDEPDEIGFRLILDKNFGPWNATVNYWAANAIDSDEDMEHSYGFGVNRPLFMFEKVNLELVGALSGEDAHYVLPSLYLPLTESLDLKAGAAFGISHESEDFSIRSAVHFMF